MQVPDIVTPMFELGVMRGSAHSVSDQFDVGDCVAEKRAFGGVDIVLFPIVFSCVAAVGERMNGELH